MSEIMSQLCKQDLVYLQHMLRVKCTASIHTVYVYCTHNVTDDVLIIKALYKLQLYMSVVSNF